MIASLPREKEQISSTSNSSFTPGKKNGNIKTTLCKFMGFPDNSVGKDSACNAGDPGSISGSGRSSEEGIGYPPHMPRMFALSSLVMQSLL